jgi:uncharacterized protein (TIRG00374 family)
VKTLLVIVLKLGISLALITYLVTDVQRRDPNTFTRLRSEPKDWSVLATAAACALTGLMLNVGRWHLLIRTLGLPYRLRQTFRLGVLAYLFDFIAVGPAGGDLVRAVLLARDQPGRRAAAVATVVVDRAIGFSILLVTTSIVTWLMPLPDPGPPVRAIIGTARLLTVAATVAILLFLAPRTLYVPLTRWIRMLPKTGAAIERLIAAIRMYRQHLEALALACLLGGVILVLNVTAIYLIARGLPAGGPTWGEHLLIVPLTLMSGIVPLPGGLGVLDYTISYLYAHVSAAHVAAGQGLLVVMTGRIISIVFVIMGAGFYLASRREVSTALHQTTIVPGSDVAR